MDRHEAFNSISHLVGAVAALIGAAVLIVFAGIDGDTRRIVSFSIYGATLFLLYLMSTLYHGTQGRTRRVFKIFDHQAIYLLIAGTYTPFALATLRDATGWWLFGAIWTLALLGMVLDALPRKSPRVLAMVIYLVMGWMCVLVINPLIAKLSVAGFYWLLAGGVFYTVGVVFYALGQRIVWAHGVWHVFVLAGSACHYVAILFYA
ncbi:MAG: hemolysin III family protein [Gammaproteobacteria bacterium]|nr:hemolysin III family protein [Gammaproteobacteria bacterium]